MNENEKLYKAHHRNYKSIEELYDDLSNAIINCDFENNKIIIHCTSDTLEIEPSRWGYCTYLNGKREADEWEDQDIYFYALAFVQQQQKGFAEFEDTSIVRITNEGVTYCDIFGRNHFVRYEDCAMNGPTASCVAEQDITKWYFKFYSPSVSIKIMFRSLFVFKKGKRFLTGRREKRFRTLQQSITDSGFTTCDLS
ncbi:MAG: hypothetical protein IJY82_07000 [Oscillospiraceae bacterium]|nr:hypothetical protein [Oscillospiraceae bacterium]